MAVVVRREGGRESEEEGGRWWGGVVCLLTRQHEDCVEREMEKKNILFHGIYCMVQLRQRMKLLLSTCSFFLVLSFPPPSLFQVAFFSFFSPERNKIWERASLHRK